MIISRLMRAESAILRERRCGLPDELLVFEFFDLYDCGNGDGYTRWFAFDASKPHLPSLTILLGPRLIEVADGEPKRELSASWRAAETT